MTLKLSEYLSYHRQLLTRVIGNNQGNLDNQDSSVQKPDISFLSSTKMWKHLNAGPLQDRA